MKRKQIKRYKLLVVFTCIALFLWNCKDDPNSTGMDLLPGSDLKTVGQNVEKESISAFTKKDGPLRTDEPNFNVFGTFNDPVFGKTTASFVCQLRLGNFPDFGNSPQLDSIVLRLLYKDFYGDTVTAQSLKVYELQQDVFLDTTSSSGSTGNFPYYQDVDLKALASDIPIGELDFVPKFEMDSTETDTLIQELSIKLDNSIAEKLMNADSIDLVNNDAFVQFFKGLYVEAQDVAEGGALLDIYTLARGSNLTIYYHNEEEDSLSFTYWINSNSARISNYTHDYAATEFVDKLEDETTPDSLLYLQTMGGLKAKLDIPSLDSWIDSTGFVINKASLVFQADTTASDFHNFAIPDLLVLYAIDKDGKKYLPSDFYVSSALFGGNFNEVDASYRFNITHHLQDIIDGKINNYGFYLYTTYRNERMRRVVLKGSTSHVGIRLEVTYTKLN